mmetsp:Transcript_16905/g.33741  ORF Transcript_16905/g.33741 Transcript_16905/m.33741 type:complete len:107 (+) Transcript_16905:578-898(+)
MGLSVLHHTVKTRGCLLSSAGAERVTPSKLLVVTLMLVPSPAGSGSSSCRISGSISRTTTVSTREKTYYDQICFVQVSTSALRLRATVASHSARMAPPPGLPVCVL